ncbi:MAG: hypothetical protein IJ706_02275 [Clostridia bacterium]|nr:hypothetical protein [Clostridia bacterium]
MGNQITKFMFYELYWSLIKNESDQTAGRFIKRICQYMFTGNKLPTLKDKKEAFIWSNIEDFLIRSKEAEKNGKNLKTLNQKMRHFAFLETYYRAVDLMDDEQSGAYLKALCKYMFEGVETTKLIPPADAYFALAKLKLSLSKKRSNAAKTGRKTEKKSRQNEFSAVGKNDIKETGKAIEEEVKPMTFEEFMGLHPAIKDDIYPNGRGVLRSVDWAMLNELIETDKPLEQSHSLYWLLQSEKYRAAIKNG